MNTAPVLLVDDDTMLLHALSQAIELRLSTVEVETVDSAQGALKLLQGREYSTIISDIKMPGMDGFELLAQVQVLYPDIPVMLITGHNDHRAAIRALREGAYDYILKPIDRDDFVAALNRALYTYQLRQQIKEQQRALERCLLSPGQRVSRQTSE